MSRDGRGEERARDLPVSVQILSFKLATFSVFGSERVQERAAFALSASSLAGQFSVENWSSLVLFLLSQTIVITVHVSLHLLSYVPFADF